MHGHLEVNSCGDQQHSAQRMSVFQTRFIKKWDYYVAAVERDWDYESGTSENFEK